MEKVSTDINALRNFVKDFTKKVNDGQDSFGCFDEHALGSFGKVVNMSKQTGLSHFLWDNDKRGSFKTIKSYYFDDNAVLELCSVAVGESKDFTMSASIRWEYEELD